MGNNARDYRLREMRVESRPDDRNFVHFESQDSMQISTAAQFTDISSTGMRLISRAPAKTNVGDLLNVRFSLPGSREEVKARARVVRQISDFEFAVVFSDFRESQKRLMQTAIQDYIRYLRSAPLAKRVTQITEWFEENRKGITIGLIGLIIFSAAFTYIYSTSDAASGKSLKSWAAPYPKNWDWDYYNKIPKDPNKPAPPIQGETKEN